MTPERTLQMLEQRARTREDWHRYGSHAERLVKHEVTRGLTLLLCVEYSPRAEHLIAVASSLVARRACEKRKEQGEMKYGVYGRGEMLGISRDEALEVLTLGRAPEWLQLLFTMACEEQERRDAEIAEMNDAELDALFESMNRPSVRIPPSRPVLL